MREILAHLPPYAIVLDLACSGESFDSAAYPFLTVHFDLERTGAPHFVQGDAAALPFRAGSFDAVVCNHGLEHFANLEKALREVGRVVKRGGALFVSVPDAASVTDRLYRWLYHGGGHLNLFRSESSLADLLAERTGLRHVATRHLYSSFRFLNRRNLGRGLPARVALFSFRREAPLILLNGIARLLDRRFGTRTSFYGWALYFGAVPEAVDTAPWINVCMRCGSGHSAACLSSLEEVRRTAMVKFYRCPACRAVNLFFAGD